ncbi:hypothetical protein HORM4_950059 [Vibrio harveyi]|nr:hypothetical protein HORM4_950059 [Vibrio harveyi]
MEPITLVAKLRDYLGFKSEKTSHKRKDRARGSVFIFESLIERIKDTEILVLL